jgi:hypothetical protein
MHWVCLRTSLDFTREKTTMKYHLDDKIVVVTTRAIREKKVVIYLN